MRAWLPNQGHSLYVLTIVSVSAMPLQLLSGLWGMNFVGEETDVILDNTTDPVTYEMVGGMAELSLSYGYTMFWSLSGGWV
jgi:Mg2+ and Co2+ transporter CorA